MGWRHNLPRNIFRVDEELLPSQAGARDARPGIERVGCGKGARQLAGLKAQRCARGARPATGGMWKRRASAGGSADSSCIVTAQFMVLASLFCGPVSFLRAGIVPT